MLRKLPQWWRAWLARRTVPAAPAPPMTSLPPSPITLKNSGHESVQLGQVGGNVTIVHVTQHLVTTTVAAQPLTPTVPAPMAQPPAQPAQPHRPSGGVANDDQRHVLQLIRRLPHPAPVHDFMQREFGTHMVIHLQPRQLHRVRRYVEKIIQTAEPATSAARPVEQTQGERR